MSNLYKVVLIMILKFAWLFGPCFFYISELLRYLVQGYTLYIPFNEHPDWAVVFVWNTATIWLWCIGHYIFNIFQQPKENELVYE
jgi:hypothetical protein